VLVIDHLLLLAAAASGPEAPPLALSPAYQRLAELRAIAEKPGIVDALKEVPIERVEYVSSDLYRVTAGKCRLEARIVDLPRPHNVAGGRRFEVQVGKAVCRG
jgi:hypothetical protein